MATREQALTAFQTALRHVGEGNMVSSARLCLSDAAVMLSQGQWDFAKERSMTSLQYSIGILHQDYINLIKTNSTMSMPAVRVS